MDAILLDFSKAFDKVPHQRLLLKLRHYGIRGNLLDWIEDFSSERTQEVLVEGQHSSSAKVTSGVPQGTVMGPLLFLVFINDQPECVKSTPRLFADDCLLYRPIRSKADSEELQADLHVDKLQKWENNWLMSFNPNKCEVIHITNKRKQLTSDYYIHGKKLVTVPSAKYLGLHFQNNHIDTITKKANSSTAFLNRNLKGCPPSVKERCYTALVHPLVEYASTVSPHTAANINKIEQVQRRDARFVNNVFGR